MRFWGKDIRKKQRITIRLDSDLLEKVQQESQKNNNSISGTIRQVLQNYLNC